MKVSRNWLQTYFEQPLPSGKELVELFMFHSFEVEGSEEKGDDVILDIDVLANRSSDCLCHRGMARELSTLLAIPMKRDPLREPVQAWEEPSSLMVTVEDGTHCPRYMGAVVRGITVGPSPEWLVRALESVGQRSINNIVDATNYVMWNIGQPLHAFDVSKLEAGDGGVRTIAVRQAYEGESITTLTGESYTLSPQHMVIADGVADVPIALAGIKGGKTAEIGQETIDIIVEAATFDYVSVRKTSRELRLATDASVRFQNEPGRELPPLAMRDVLALIQDVAGGEVQGVRDVFAGGTERAPISFTQSEANAVLGITQTPSDVEHTLVRLEWEFSRSEDRFTVTPSWERSDVTTKEGVFEELGRLYGYRTIAGVLPPDAPRPTVNKRYYYSEKVRRMLVDLGYDDVLTYTLREHGDVELANPLASDKAFLRRDLSEGLTRALEENVSRAALLGIEDVRLFEVGEVWTKAGEDLHIALGVRPFRSKLGTLTGAFAKDVQKIRSALGLAEEAAPISDTYEFSLSSVLDTLPDPDAYDLPLPWDPTKRFVPWSPYPCALRDIAVWVRAGVPEEEVLAVIIEQAPDTLVRHDIFDRFEKDGKVSYAWHLVFQARDRTLTDSELTTIMDAVTNALNGRDGWVVR